MDKSIAAVNLCTSARGLVKPTPVPRMSANIYISIFTVYSGVLLFGACHLADFIITYLPPRKSFFNAKWGGIYRRNSQNLCGGIYRCESHFSTVNAAVFTAAIAPCYTNTVERRKERFNPSLNKIFVSDCWYHWEYYSPDFLKQLIT